MPDRIYNLVEITDIIQIMMSEIRGAGCLHNTYYCDVHVQKRHPEKETEVNIYI